MSSIGSISYIPQGTWSISANTPTIVPKDNWLCNASSDFSANEQIGAQLMTDDSGNYRMPYESRFQIQMMCDVQNDFGYNGDGNVQVIYVPGNQASASPTYVIATGTFSSSKPVAQLSSIVHAKEGDLFQIKWTFASGLNVTVDSSKQIITNFVVTDLVGVTTPCYWYGVSGTPLTIGTQAQNSVMLSSVIKNNAATFIVTQDGTANGTSLFTQGISYVDMSIQANVNDPTLTPPSDWWLPPYPSDLKTITVYYAKSGSTQTSSGQPVVWTANGIIEGA